jgi:hypothetical protein
MSQRVPPTSLLWQVNAMKDDEIAIDDKGFSLSSSFTSLSPHFKLLDVIRLMLQCLHSMV